MKRGNSALGPLTDDNNARPANKRPKKKPKKAPRQSKRLDDSFQSFVTVEGDEDTQHGLAFYKAFVNKLRKQVEDVSSEMKQQQKLVAELTTQMSFVTSWLENSITPEQCTAAFKDFAAAVKRPAAAVDRAAQESVVAAVYVDSQRRQNRATNFIVSGLPPSDVRPDQNAVIDLCRREFNEVADVVHCKRLGKPIAGRVQPLLVVLKTAAQAVRIISAAKNLRQSTDPHTCQHVYIAANLTKAEARAAYEVRCERRQAAERRKKLQLQQQQQAPNNVAALGRPATATHQSQQPWRKQPQEQQAPIIVGGPSAHKAPQRYQQHQPSPPPPPAVYQQTSVVAAEVHQPPARLEQHQQMQQVQQQHQQWWQQQPSATLRFASPSSSQQQQLWQQSQPQLLIRQPLLDVTGAPTSSLLPASTSSSFNGGTNQHGPQQHQTTSTLYNVGGDVPPSSQPFNVMYADYQPAPTYNSLQFPAPPCWFQRIVQWVTVMSVVEQLEMQTCKCS